MTKEFEIKNPPLSLEEVRKLDLVNRETDPVEFQKCIDINPYIYDNDVALVVDNWLYVFGPGDWNEPSFYAEYITEEGQLDFRADENASEWEVVNNEVYDV
jgi:hypothetical protein